jgi:hypothetical protein
MNTLEIMNGVSNKFPVMGALVGGPDGQPRRVIEVYQAKSVEALKWTVRHDGKTFDAVEDRR